MCLCHYRGYYCLVRPITGRDATAADVASINFPAFWVVEEVSEGCGRKQAIWAPTSNH